MKTIAWKCFAGLALVAASCSSASAPGPIAEPIAFRGELRLLGTNAAQYGSVLLDVKRVDVTANGQHLAVSPPNRTIELTNAQQAYLVGAFDVPQGVDKVHVSLRIDDFGGFQSLDGKAAGDIDARTRPIEFDAPVSSLATHKSATVQLDVGRSLVAQGNEARVLVPNLKVAY